MPDPIQIERGFRMNTTGTQVGNGQFSRDMVGTIVGEYVYLASKLSERRWNRIMELCGAQEMGQGTEHSVSINRRAMYEPSSPIKVSDNDANFSDNDANVSDNNANVSDNEVKASEFDSV
jgi:hypothetical protein